MDLRGGKVKHEESDDHSKEPFDIIAAPRYYIRTRNIDGNPTDANKWIIYMQGGGWCWSDEVCKSRANMSLGSSKFWPTQVGPLEGAAFFADPKFANFTVVYAKYCDGGSWTGAATTAPRVIDGVTVYYRGRVMLDGLFEQLYATEGFRAAKEVVYSGCSAGGLTTYIHADYIRDKINAMNKDTAVVAFADAMFSLDHPAYGQKPGESTYLQTMFNFGWAAWEAEDSVDPDCVAAMAAAHGGNRSEGWRCMYGSAVAPYVQTPTFILNSKYDSWQSKAIIGVSCKMLECNASIQKFWTDYGNLMLEKLDAVPARHGAYVRNCEAHCETGDATFWNNDTISGMGMGGAFNIWYDMAIKNQSESVPRHVERCDVAPCKGDICDGKKY